MRWSPGSPGPAAERAWSPDAQQRLETVGRILDESRDLLDVALDRNTTVEHGLRRADQQTRDPAVGRREDPAGQRPSTAGDAYRPRGR